MQLTASSFKAYDIRGIVPSALNEEFAAGLGRAFGTLALREGQKSVAVGRDGVPIERVFETIVRKDIARDFRQGREIVIAERLLGLCGARGQQARQPAYAGCQRAGRGDANELAALRLLD